MFEAVYYKVTQIDGDYAHLTQVDDPGAEDKLVARALLPESISEGTVVKYEMLQYTVE